MPSILSDGGKKNLPPKDYVFTIVVFPHHHAQNKKAHPQRVRFRKPPIQVSLEEKGTWLIAQVNNDSRNGIY